MCVLGERSYTNHMLCPGLMRREIEEKVCRGLEREGGRRERERERERRERECFILYIVLQGYFQSCLERRKRRYITTKVNLREVCNVQLAVASITCNSVAFQSVGHEVATYEDVVKLMPDINRRRPIVLIGP